MGGEAKAVAVVALEGEIDLSAVSEVEQRIAAAEAGGPAELILDLRQVTFMDSSGLRVLLGAHHRAEERGGEFAVVRGGEAVERLLEVTGLASRLRLLDEPPSAG
jgi:anti-anti-sigma factor